MRTAHCSLTKEIRAPLFDYPNEFNTNRMISIQFSCIGIPIIKCDRHLNHKRFISQLDDPNNFTLVIIFSAINGK